MTPFAETVLVALVGVLVIASLSCLVGSIVTWRAMRHVTPRDVALDTTQFAVWRARLADQRAGLERSLWALSRFDGGVTSTTGAVAARRAALDRVHANLLHSRDAMARFKRTWQALRRAIELMGAMGW